MARTRVQEEISWTIQLAWMRRFGIDPTTDTALSDLRVAMRRRWPQYSVPEGWR